MPPSSSQLTLMKKTPSLNFTKLYPKEDQSRIVSKRYPNRYPNPDQSRIVSNLKQYQSRISIRIVSNQLDQTSATEEQLPPEIWKEIGKRLQSRLDLVRFRSVCRTWRSSLPPPSLFPLRVPPPPGCSVDLKDASLFITELTYYAVNQMIVVFEEEYRGGKFSASAFVPEALVRDMKFEIPSVSDLSSSSSSSSSLSFLCNAYHLHIAYQRCRQRRIIQGKSDFFPITQVRKIVIISNNTNNNSDSDYYYYVNPNYINKCNLTVVAHLYDKKLAVLRLGGGGGGGGGGGDNKWETGFCTCSFEDIVNYKGKLYAVHKSGGAFVLDYNSLQMTQVANALGRFMFTPALRGICRPVVGLKNKRKKLNLAVSSSGILYFFSHGVRKPELYKLLSKRGIEDPDGRINQEWVRVGEKELDGVFFVKEVHCNLSVESDLFRVGGGDNNNKYEVPRVCPWRDAPLVCAWPEFVFVRLAVGFKNKYQPRFSCRDCDVPWLSYQATKPTD